ncbi:MAG: rRNA maturation RNase YbeY [Opitutaceae bacterium]|nr:rRNA maturation RNase YbeY [Opitutaceae bacterium]
MRVIALANQHPDLTVPRAAVRNLIRCLDDQFRIADADWASFSPEAKSRHPRASATGRASVSPSPAVPDGELSLVFLTDPALAAVHGQFLDDPSRTDVITFEGDPLMGTAGEICVSADTAQRYATDHSRPFAEELTLYLVHGWLHLAGYDDLEPRKKRRMRAAEARAMALLRSRELIPAFSLSTGRTRVRPRARR